MSSGFIYVVRVSFLFEGYLQFHCIYIPYLPIHSSAVGHLGCLHILAILNNSAVSIGVSFQDPDFSYFGYIRRSGIAGSYGNFIYLFIYIYLINLLAALGLCCCLWASSL